MKGNKGITLIALIITIIVLLILAGVTIAMLMGDHGILTQTDAAKVTTIEGEAYERVKLSVQTARLGIANKVALDNDSENPYDATHDGCIDVVNWIKEDTVNLDANKWDVTVTGNTVKIVYKGADYVKATDTEGATITYTVTVSAQSLDLSNTIEYNPAHS